MTLGVTLGVIYHSFDGKSVTLGVTHDQFFTSSYRHKNNFNPKYDARYDARYD